MRLLLLLSFVSLLMIACEQPEELNRAEKKPALVIGIVVDQMRPDYLTRYSHHFSEGGFKRLIKGGFYNKNTHYNYIPTYTGPGHASIYTGATPATHGIIGNDWYDRNSGESVYCAGDPSKKSVGTSSDDGEMSPHRLLSTTITDELMLASNFRAKVIGVSLKDRGSIIPAGHTPTAAYWFDGHTGDFISSSFYMDDLPSWLQTFNDLDLTQQYLDSSWSLSLKKEAYYASTEDNMIYEDRLDTAKDATFPYDLKHIKKQFRNTGLIKTTPFGNTILTDMALATMEAEEMGMDSITDFLALSYSSTDYIGHSFGSRSVEMEDTYIKLDLEIERLFKYLDETVGEGNYLLFLTADHAAAEVPKYLMDYNIPAGYYNPRYLKERIDSALDSRFGKGDWVEYFSNEQLYFNYELINEKKLSLDEVVDFALIEVLKIDGVTEAYSGSAMRANEFTMGMKMRLQNGYNFKRSGDLLIVLAPAWLAKRNVGTSHGSGYTYDTHVPLIWYGTNISAGESYKPQTITDIAPTLSFMLGTSLPNGATGEPIEEVLVQN